MANDPMDLPVRKPVTPSQTAPRKVLLEVPLTEQHVGQILDIGGKVTEGAVAIGRDLLEIVRIREQAQGEVAVIEAKTRAVVETIKAQTEQIMKRQEGIPKRVQAATAIIQAVMKHIPDTDHEARKKAIDTLNELVGIVISEGSHRPSGF